MDPAFKPETEALARLETVAWDAYIEGRKAPVTRKADPGYADPGYDLSVEWLDTKKRLEKAQAHWKKKTSPSRVLLICGYCEPYATSHDALDKDKAVQAEVRNVANAVANAVAALRKGTLSQPDKSLTNPRPK